MNCVGFLGGTASAATGVALNGGGTFEDYMTQMAISGGFGFAFGGAMALAAGKNFFTGKTTLQDKTRLFVEENRKPMEELVGKEALDNAAVKGRRLMIGKLGKTVESGAWDNSSGDACYGENLVKFEGSKCKIFISSRLINAYFKGDQQLAIATFGHELYHSRDFASGYADYLFYTKGGQYQNDYMEWNAYEFEYKNFGTGYQKLIEYRQLFGD